MLLEQRVARMPALLERARRLANTLESIDGVTVHRQPPHVNMFRVVLGMEADAALDARDRVAERLGLWVFGQVTPAGVPGHYSTEIYVGEATVSIADADIAEAFQLADDRRVKSNRPARPTSVRWRPVG